MRRMDVKASIDKCLEVMSDPQAYVTSHPKGESVEVKEEFSATAKVTHFKYKGNMVVKPRDLCLAECVIELKNNSIVVLRFSVEHEMVPVGKHIRATLNSAHILAPIASKFIVLFIFRIIMFYLKFDKSNTTFRVCNHYYQYPML